MTKQTRRTIFATLLASPFLTAFRRPTTPPAFEITGLDSCRRSLGQLRTRLDVDSARINRCIEGASDELDMYIKFEEEWTQVLENIAQSMRDHLRKGGL